MLAILIDILLGTLIIGAIVMFVFIIVGIIKLSIQTFKCIKL